MHLLLANGDRLALNPGERFGQQQQRADDKKYDVIQGVEEMGRLVYQIIEEEDEEEDERLRQEAEANENEQSEDDSVGCTIVITVTNTEALSYCDDSSELDDLGDSD
ncbi:hypothetical protein GGI23_007304, partial [Coemansia sp. RSA 2559]